MTRILIVVAVLICTLAIAQRVDVLREANVEVNNAVIFFPDDGGCQLQVSATATWDSGMQAVSNNVFPFNGARCQTVKVAAKRAANTLFNVGDGGVP